MSAFAGAVALLVALAVGPGRSVSRAEGPRSRRISPRFDDGTAGILRRRCVRCHGPVAPDAELRLDGFSGVMRGGETGPAVVERDPDASLLYRKVRRLDRPAMPPRVPLPAAEREVIRAWIAAGALPDEADDLILMSCAGLTRCLPRV